MVGRSGDQVGEIQVRESDDGQLSEAQWGRRKAQHWRRHPAPCRHTLRARRIMRALYN